MRGVGTPLSTAQIRLPLRKKRKQYYSSKHIRKHKGKNRKRAYSTPPTKNAMQNEKKKEKILFYPTKNTVQTTTTKKSTIPPHLPNTQRNIQGNEEKVLFRPTLIVVQNNSKYDVNTKSEILTHPSSALFEPSTKNGHFVTPCQHFC